VQNSAALPAVFYEDASSAPASDPVSFAGASALLGDLQKLVVPFSRRGPWSISLTLLAGAGAAMLLPETSGTAAAGAALLAVGALALLAGHTWGLMVSIPSHLTLVGRLWPHLSLAQDADGSVHAAATALILVTAIPALALAAVILPQIAEHLLPRATRRMRSALVAGSTLALAAALIVPSIP
jgi:hypothetical protein